MNKLVSLAEANALIDARKYIHVAGSEAVLRRLHRGTWIGGTTPYFLTRVGGVVEREKVFVTEFPDSINYAVTRMVDIGHILDIPMHTPVNGFSLTIVPGMSDIHTAYALTANNLPGIHEMPIIGWVAGVHLNDLGKATPKVFDGATGEVSDNRIAVMHAAVRSDMIAKIGTINLFHLGEGDDVVFENSGFSAGPCTINGQPDDFYDYVVRNKLDQSLPLITERSGERINVSFQALDDAERMVKFYAPLLKGLVYRQAAPLTDYRLALIEATKDVDFTPAFSCNCILNFLYGHLEGTQYIPVPGPATFGEVAHVLLNQTLVYLTLSER